MKKYFCEICGKLLFDYKPEYCCNGVDCGCMGLPIEPPWCDKCWKNIIDKEINKEILKGE